MNATWLRSVLLLAVGFFPAGAEEIWTFTTADGSKVMKASIERILPDKEGKRFLEIKRVDNGKRYSVLSEIFSKEDQAYIEETAALMDGARNLSIRITPVEDRSSPEKTNGRSVVNARHTFSIELRNNGESTLDDLKVEYRVFYRKAKRVWDSKGSQRIGKSKREDAYKEGELAIASVKPRVAQTLTTTPLMLVHDRPNRGGPG